MSPHRLCPECQRHVRVAETACPFCAAELSPEPAPARRGGSAMTRAALFAGATLLSGAACADKPEPKEPDEIEQRDTDTEREPIDDGVDKDGNRTQESVERDKEREAAEREEERRRKEEAERQRELDRTRDRDIAKPYGGPPSRERAV